MDYGWTGRILCLDLAGRTQRILRPGPELYATCIGGKGLAGWILEQAGPRAWDDPDLPLGIFTGPLVGTIAPTSGRATVICRSPLTSALADASVGGAFGTELKRAGWDGVVITGRADGLVGVAIRDREVQIIEAADMAGWTTEQVHAVCHGAGSIMSVGPAAERGVRFASVAVDRHHAAGRCGLGACFAARNLKYVTVKGTGRTQVHDLKALKAAREAILRLTAASPVLTGRHGFLCYGTAALFDLMHARRMMPTDNFRATRFETAPSLNAAALKARYRPKRRGCKGCHINCKGVAENGFAMPEFETLSHFSALLGNDDLDLVVQANRLCNLLGLDTISAASTLACYQECTGQRLAPARILALLEDIGQGRGVGLELGQGSLRYATAQGRPEASMSVKGLELPAYDPRGAYGLALGYAVSTRGGCHLRSYPISHEILRKPVATDRFSFSGKARIIKIAEDANAVVDSLTACKFVFFAATLEEYAWAYAAVTGVATTSQELLAAGERICYRERTINAGYGLDARHDDLPQRFFTQPGTGGEGISIPPLDRASFLDARARYYRIRGLSPEGRPQEEEARRLGLRYISSQTNADGS